MNTINISHLAYDEAQETLAEFLAEKNHINCTIEFGADHSQSKIIRDFVGKIFDIHKIEHPWRGRFILITDELINNAIEHGSLQGDIDSCIIDAGVRDSEGFYIVLEVHDTGRGKDSKDVTHMGQIKDQKMSEHNKDGIYMEKRGRGLFHITEKLVDRLSFAESPRGGLAVKIEKNIPLNQTLLSGMEEGV